MKLSLPALALKRPVTVLVVIVTVIGLGEIARQRIPLEFIPPIDLPFIICQIPYVGATPEQVEKEVAIPAEGEFRTLSSLKRITSTSDMNGCTIRLMFNLDTDMTVATADVRDRMERLKLVLPQEIERIYLRKFSADSMPIMALAIYGPGDDEELAYLVRTVLQPRLMRVDGVADVSVFGKPEKEVLIEFDQAALRSRGVGLFEVVSALRQSSINLTAGEMVDGETKYFVRTFGEFRTPEEIARLVIGPNSLRLRDVARVGYRAREVEMGYAIDGQSGTFIIIRKESEANAVATCEGVRQELEKMKTDPLFADVQTFMFFDQAKIIVAALDGVLGAAELGASLAIIVLFAFLLRVRPTLIVAVAIPASIVVALIFMFFAGMSLNLVTMIGMMVVLGMLVDNSIVVIENITRHQELGFDPKESALLGASEVAMAITASTLTTLVVGVPLLYLDAGQMATYMRQFMIPIGVALTASLVIALTAIPLAASRMKPRAQLRIVRMFRRPMAAQGPASGGGSPAYLLNLSVPRAHPIKALLDYYVRVLDWVLRWRMATACIVGAIIGISLAIPFRNLERQAEPTMDPRRVEIRLVLEQGFDFPKAKATMESLQNAIEPFREELGIKSIFVRYDRNGGSCDIHLLTDEDLPEGGTFPYTTDEVMDILWQRLARKIPGGELRFSIADASETSSRQFSLQIRGEDARVLQAYAERMKTVMRARIPEVMEVTTDAGREEREIQVRVNEALSSTYGLSPMAIAQTVDFALRGVRLTYLKQGGREIPVWAQFQEEDRKSKSNLENVTVFSAQGAPVPINRVVDFAKEASPQSINRVNGKNVITLTAKTKGENLGRVMKELKALLSDFELPAGYTFEFGDELASLNENMANFGTALLLAVILIYVVMGALFESYLLPWSILTALPLAGIGVVWSLYLSGTALDIVAMIGIILLAGIIVNNGIVLIDFINQLRQRGRSRREAILEAGRARMRPIMMTALTTILGCVPLVLGKSLGADVSFEGLGWALIGGLTVGTVLTLIIVPLAYTAFDDLRLWFVSFFGTLSRLSAAPRRARP